MKETKASLRREFREARSNFARNHGAGVRARLEAHITRLIHDLGGESIGLYRPLKEEASFEIQGEHFYPRVEGEDLRFLRPRADGKFLKGALGVEEPDPVNSEAGSPRVVFTPAVAVDSRGGRLGMGRGFYDRYFERHPDAIRVGVVFQVQVSKTPLPREEWDRPLDWIVTEQMILETSTRSS